MLKIPIILKYNDIYIKSCKDCRQYKLLNSDFYARHRNARNPIDAYVKRCASCRRKNRSGVKTHFDNNGNLYCRYCETYKNKLEFHKDNKSFHRDFRGSECVGCQNKRKVKYLKTALRNKDDINLFFRELSNRCKQRYSGLAVREIGGSIEYDITSDFLKELYKKQDGRCAISGIKMLTLVGSGRQKLNASVDRINCNVSYNKNNVRLVCAHINMMRGNLEISELLEFCDKILKYNGK